jgi:hypothetical protein
MSQPGTATSAITPVIEPGQSKEFVYVGELIPNQVLVKNLGDTEVQYWLTSGIDSWRLYNVVEGGRTQSIELQWMNGIATFTNEDGTSSIEIGGDGIFPYDPTTGEAVKG